MPQQLDDAATAVTDYFTFPIMLIVLLPPLPRPEVRVGRARVNGTTEGPAVFFTPRKLSQ